MVRTSSVQVHRFELLSRFVGVLLVLVALASGGRAQKIVSTATSMQHAPEAHPMDQTDPFLPVVPYDSGTPEVFSMAVADLNHDGKQDVVVVNANTFEDESSIGVLLGNGDGTFQPTVVYDAGTTGATSVAIGDLNNDGNLDLVVGSSGFISVLLGNGDGSFRPAVVYASGAGSVYSRIPLLLADLNGDGKLDVIVGSRNIEVGVNGSAAVLLNNGDGTFQTGKTYDSGGFFISSVAVADLNADGIQDLVVVNCAASGSSSCFDSGGTVGVLLGKGDGTFRTVQNYARGGWGASWSPVIVADVNGDGKPDILVGNSCEVKFKGEDGSCTNDGSVGVLTGNGDGTFRPAVSYDTGSGDAASIVLADIDGDGKLDLVVQNGGGASVLRGKGDGTFLYPDRYVSPVLPGSAVWVGDINGDGKPDLIGLGGTSIDFLWVMLGNGSGFTQLFTYMTGYELSQAVIQDVNSDGRDDLLSVYGCSNSYGCQGVDGTFGVQLSNPGFIYNSTLTRVTTNVDPAPPNQPVNYTVTVTNPGGTAVTGDVTCFAKRWSANKTLVNNQAIFSITYPTAGTHEVQCSYSGDSGNLGSTSLNLPEYIQPLPVPSKTTIATSGTPSHFGQPVTFTAKVTSPYGTIPDGELVTFSAGKTVLGSVPLSASTARFTTSGLSVKTHTIKAVYAGDGSFKPSQGTVAQVVEP
ncbi:MAG TPA: FG-GAP-like repeat-containing protein [Terriglobales bacterium]|nr:FG-GAP-like repeat-containing protein [Terriglobales bacterium]